MDLFHGAKPYIVTTCNDQGRQRWWEWPVDPVTRDVDADPAEVDQIQQLVDSADIIYLHNAKYDVRACWTVGISLPFHKLRCTLFASHLLASNHAHDLYSTAIEHLPGIDPGKLQGFEDQVKEATRECRRRIKAGAFDWLGANRWRLAREGDEMMPSVDDSTKREEDKSWKNDMWLMRSLATAILGHPATDKLTEADLDLLRQADYPLGWLNSTVLYANGDSSVTVPLGIRLDREIERRGLSKIYAERLKLIKVAAKLEDARVTANKEWQRKAVLEYSEHVDLCQAECTAIAEGFNFDLELPQGAAPNDSIREFFWGSTRLICPRCGTETKHKEWAKGKLNGNGDLDCPKCLKRKARPGPATVKRKVVTNPCLNLPIMYKEKTGGPCLDVNVLETYRTTLDPGPALDFIESLVGMRSRQTAVSYLKSYERFWLPLGGEGNDGWVRLSPSFNPTGTDTLRWSSYCPNATNISKKEDFNLRQCFGPAPGREWWSMDGKNLELRIPAYEAGEEAMIELFERPNDPPYFGSYHLLNASIVFAEEFYEPVCPDCAGMGHLLTDRDERCGCLSQGRYVGRPKVQLCEIEGAFKTRYASTLYRKTKNGGFAIQYGCGERKADMTFGRRGAYQRIKEKLPKIAQLNQRCLEMASKLGWVETIPDRSIDPTRGYPILASRTEDGWVLPTTPFNYHIQGTAGQWINRAMVRCGDRIEQWNGEGWDGFLTMEIHDELVFDTPAGTGPEPWRTNLPRMKELARLMEMGGNDIMVPTPVSIEYHDVNWSKGLAM